VLRLQRRLRLLLLPLLRKKSLPSERSLMLDGLFIPDVGGCCVRGAGVICVYSDAC
jgi:hypothetical protein